MNNAIKNIRAMAQGYADRGMAQPGLLRDLVTAADEIEAVRAQRDELLAACSEAHALLYHYELRRETNGVEWGEPEALRQKMIEKLWDAITKACPELAQKARSRA